MRAAWTLVKTTDRRSGTRTTVTPSSRAAVAISSRAAVAISSRAAVAPSSRAAVVPSCPVWRGIAASSATSR